MQLFITVYKNISIGPRITKLVDLGAEVNLQNNNGDTALMLAARYNPDAAPPLLAAQGIDVNLQDNHGVTALILAAQYNRLSIIQDLLAARGIDVNIQANNGSTALMWAVLKQPEVVPMLLAAHADVDAKNNDGWTALMYALHYNPEAVPALLAAHADVDPKIIMGGQRLCMHYTIIRKQFQLYLLYMQMLMLRISMGLQHLY